MSSDLLAEFDSFYRAPGSVDAGKNTTPASNDLAFLSAQSQHDQKGMGAQWQSQPTMNARTWENATSFHSNANNGITGTTQDDIWGSFEDADQVKASPQVFSPAPPRYGGAVDTRQKQIQAGVIRRSTLDIFSKNLNDLESMPNIPSTRSDKIPPTRPAATSKSPFGEVLFDATDELSGEADDDEFGDFETVTSPGPAIPAPSSQSLDLLFGMTSLESKPSSKRPKDLLPSSAAPNASMLPYPQAPKSPSFQERNPFGHLGLAMNQVSAIKKADKPQTASPVTVWPSFQPPKPDPYQDSPTPDQQADEEWGDFADLPPETPAVAIAKAASGIEAEAWAWDAADRVSSPPANVLPPTNVPPPSVILTLFPSLFDLPQSTLFKNVANQPFSLKNRILSDPSTIDFLRAYLLIATVAARIIAGRKQRWKRDTILSQSMKIGPAAAGGKGGMKLAGVDKAEVTKEDREAAEAVRVWREQLGRLRSAIAVANSSIKDVSSHLTIPEISETMHVKTQEGGLTAPKPCVICGLKRDERISKVDINVEDSFGEWWYEHWGHRACKNFWQEHESN
ncbi:hypothetical protein G7Y89_g1409 [Cudoniella acicularis]|uniref:Uncharacterized protein n=1 Tax=Cudoniella acicularis TaxID=354080 RepID=A0A8H4RW44_9HELO|nr:hypothetical protein G7Y89_g1409 [Cudoniella acicularis]